MRTSSGLVVDAPIAGLIREFRDEVRVRKVEEGRKEVSGWRAVRSGCTEVEHVRVSCG